MPQVIESLVEMRREARLARVHARRVALVPTMGALHAGHLSLLEAARRTADVVVLSIFVNPTQFGPREDLSRYPRDLAADVALAASVDCDLVFAPSAAEMYPAGYQSFVEVRELSRGLCGEQRPGHFVGVATVVLKLFQIVQPEVAFFGEKDYQQLQVIRQMAHDLNVPVEVVGLPLIREADGLALSSRNVFLSPDERRQALALSAGLFAARQRFGAGERSVEALLSAARAEIDQAPGVALEYLELRDARSLVPLVGTVAVPAVLLVAARVGQTRLIDNVLLT